MCARARRLSRCDCDLARGGDTRARGLPLPPPHGPRQRTPTHPDCGLWRCESASNRNSEQPPQRGPPPPPRSSTPPSLSPSPLVSSSSSRSCGGRSRGDRQIGTGRQDKHQNSHARTRNESPTQERGEAERTETGRREEETLFFALAAAFSFPGRVFLGFSRALLNPPASSCVRAWQSTHLFCFFSTLFLNPCNRRKKNPINRIESNRIELEKNVNLICY